MNAEKMTKLEKFWRKQSGIKSTSIKKSKSDKDKKKAPENSAKAQNDALTKAADLKKFLQKNGCFMPDLVLICAQMGMLCSVHICVWSSIICAYSHRYLL